MSETRTIRIEKPVPIKTQDAILAFCLYAAGVPEALPPSNIYDADSLKKLGYHGLTLEEAAKTAHRKNQRGTVEYYFEKTPELDYFLGAYREVQDQIKNAPENSDAGVAIREIMARAADPEKPMDEREAVLRISCIVLKLRPDFVGRWKLNSWIKISVPSPSGREPGFKMMPVNASPELRQKMNL